MRVPKRSFHAPLYACNLVPFHCTAPLEGAVKNEDTLRPPLHSISREHVIEKGAPGSILILPLVVVCKIPEDPEDEMRTPPDKFVDEMNTASALFGILSVPPEVTNT